jgi:dTDP-glucose 4,6-dehydratase
MQHVLVTGGAGFIGSNFIRFLLREDPSVKIVNLDVLTYAGNLESLADVTDGSRYTFVRGDICDRQLVRHILSEHTIDTVVHFAAESHVDRSILAPAAFVQTNVIGTFALLEAARQAWLERKGRPPDEARFLHISTDEVYGSLGPGDPAFTESTPYSPNSPYAASKAASDHLVRAYVHTYGFPGIVTNSSNNYGPYQFPEKLIPLVVLNAMEGRPLPVYGDGCQVRDWLFVEDHCEALLAVLRRGRLGETYNIGGGVQVKNIELVEQLCKTIDDLVPVSRSSPSSSLIKFVKDRPGHDRRYAMDTSKIARELGWRPHHSLEAGLKRTVLWYVGNGDWLHTVRNKGDYASWIAANYAGRGAQLA